MAANVAFAQDQPIAQNGHLAISAERLFGFVHSETSQDENGVKTSNRANALSVLGTPVGGAPISYTWPRLGFDAFLVRGISLGASLSYFRGSGYSSDSTLSAFQIAPRVGAVPFIGQRFGLWARAGMAFDYVSVGANSQTAYAFSAELAPLIVLVPRVCLTLGLIADVPLAGRQKFAGGRAIDTKVSDVGLEAGLTFGL